MATTKTTNLELRYIQPTDYFISDTFNNILDDIDSKVVGVSHLSSGAHWEVWKGQTDYVSGDIIRTPYLHSNQYLECLQGGKSGTTGPQVNVTGTKFTDGTAEWVVKAIGATDKETASIWLAGEDYLRGSLVLYNNKLFRCKAPHQSVNFDTDYSKWQEVYASISPWKTNKYYAVGDTVIKDNLLYECITANTDVAFTEVNWKIVGSISIIEDWKKETNYQKNQVVRYRGKLYRANTKHTSGTTFNDGSWTEISANIPEWKANEQYTVDNVVQKDNIMYICVNSHVSSVFADDMANWTIFHKPIANIPSWTQDTYYEVGQVVEKGGIIYRCKTTNKDASFTDSKWEILVKAIVDWKSGDSYQAGQYVNYGGSLYKCITDNNDTTFTSSKWQKIGGSVLDDWKAETTYIVNNIVRYSNDYYVCLVAHTSSTFEADYESNYWYKLNSHLDTYTASNYYAKGSTVEFNNKIYKCVTPHTSPSSGDMAEGSVFYSLDAPTVAYAFGYDASVNNATAVVYDVTTIGSSGKKLGVFRVTCDLNAGTHKFAIYGGSSSNTATHELVKEQTYTCSEYVASAKVDIDCEANLAYYHVKVVSATASGKINGISMFESTYSNWKLIGEPNERKAITDWKANTVYSVGDFVVYGNLIYKCINDHTSTSVFADDFGDGDWVEISACITHIDDWVAQRDYKIGDLVAYDAKIYRCIVNHKSTNDFSADLGDWEELSPTINQIANWGQGKKFDVGDLVMYDNVLYICNTVHTSGTIFDRTKFDAVGNLGTIPNWAKNTQYYKDQVVEYENTLYRAIDDHKSTNDNDGYFGSDDAHWELVYNNIQPYSNNTWYKTGSIVYQDGYLWRCKQNHKTNTDSVEERTFTISSDFKNYTLALGQEFTLHNIVLNTSYCGGVDISISTDGTTYTNLWHTDDAPNVENINCNSVHATHVKFTVLSVEPTPSTGASSGAYQGITGAVINTNNAYWEKLGITSGAITIWQANKQYNKDEAVFYQNKIYIAKESHLSSSTFDLTKWKYIDPTLLVDWEVETDYYKDQLIYHENIVYRVTEDFTSGNTFADTKLERITRGYLATWGANTYYNLGECVVYKNSIIRCLTPHTSGTSYDATESTNWQIIANVSAVISKWNKKIDYQIGDVVTYGDILYSCITDHTSSENSFAEDIENWKVINAGIAKWESETNYAIGAVVTAINHKLYRCIIAHTSGTTNIIDDISNWEEISPSIYEWKADTDYFIDDIVIYKNNLYRCIANHTSSATIDLDYFDWELISGIYEWETSSFYCVGNVVLHDKELYICKIKHISDVFDTDEASGKWELLSYKEVTDWASSTKYYPNQLVVNDGTLYRAIDKHTSSNDNIVTDSAHWEQVYAGIRPWATAQSYLVNDIVLINDKLYRCIVAHVSSTISEDGDNWSLLNSDGSYIWQSGTKYKINDIVLFDRVPYICTADHVSGSSFATDTSKWDLLYSNIREYANSTFYKLGSIVKRGGQIYECIKEHTSSSAGFGVGELYNGSGYLSHSLHSGSFSEVTTHTFDLGAQYDIYSIYFSQSGGYAGIRGIRFEYSIDGVDFETVYDWADPTAREGTESTVTIPTEIKPRYIKLTTTDTWHASVSSFGVSIDKLIIRGYQNYWKNLSGYANWQQNFIYDSNDIVNYENDLYCCKIAHTSDTTFTEDNWEPMTALATEQDIKDMWL